MNMMSNLVNLCCQRRGWNKKVVKSWEKLFRLMEKIYRNLKTFLPTLFIVNLSAKRKSLFQLPLEAMLEKLSKWASHVWHSFSEFRKKRFFELSVCLKWIGIRVAFYAMTATWSPIGSTRRIEKKCLENVSCAQFRSEWCDAMWCHENIRSSQVTAKRSTDLFLSNASKQSSAQKNRKSQ